MIVGIRADSSGFKDFCVYEEESLLNRPVSLSFSFPFFSFLFFSFLF